MKKIVVFFMSVLICFSLLSFAIYADDRVSDDVKEQLRDIGIGEYYTLLSFYPSTTYHNIGSQVNISSSGYVLIDGSIIRFSSILVGSSGTGILSIAASPSRIYLINSSSSFYSGWDGMVYFDNPTNFPSSFVSWYNSYILNNPVEPNVSGVLPMLGSVFSLPFIWVIISIPVGIFIVGIGVSFFKRRFVKAY